MLFHMISLVETLLWHVCIFLFTISAHLCHTLGCIESHIGDPTCEPLPFRRPFMEEFLYIVIQAFLCPALSLRSPTLPFSSSSLLSILFWLRCTSGVKLLQSNISKWPNLEPSSFAPFRLLLHAPNGSICSAERGASKDGAVLLSRACRYWQETRSSHAPQHKTSRTRHRTSPSERRSSSY